MKVADLLEHSAALWPRRRAVTHGERHITYQQLWCAVNRLSDYLQRESLPTKAPIAVLFENSIEYVTIF